MKRSYVIICFVLFGFIVPWVIQPVNALDLWDTRFPGYIQEIKGTFDYDPEPNWNYISDEENSGWPLKSELELKFYFYNVPLKSAYKIRIRYYAWLEEAVYIYYKWSCWDDEEFLGYVALWPVDVYFDLELPSSGGTLIIRFDDEYTYDGVGSTWHWGEKPELYIYWTHQT